MSKCQNPFKYENKNNQITITGLADSEYFLRIPRTIDDLPVTTLYGDPEKHCGCFSGEQDVNTVYIPETVKRIGKYAFTDCCWLQNIDVHQDNPNYRSIDGVLFNKEKTRLIAYPAQKKDAFYAIPPTVKSIDSWAFYRCWHLKQISIPESVTHIGEGAFNYTNIQNPAVKKTKQHYRPGQSLTEALEVMAQGIAEHNLKLLSHTEREITRCLLPFLFDLLGVMQEVTALPFFRVFDCIHPEEAEIVMEKDTVLGEMLEKIIQLDQKNCCDSDFVVYDSRTYAEIDFEYFTSVYEVLFKITAYVREKYGDFELNILI